MLAAIAQPLTALVVIAALGTGLWLAVDKIGDIREREVRAEYAAALQTAKDQARQDAEDAVAARQAANVPGSLARLRRDWCSDCEPVRTTP